MALAVTAVASCGSQEQDVAAQITAFEPPRGIIQPGSSAPVSVRVKNVGAQSRTLWIGYSVQDFAGGWYDAPASPVAELSSGEESDDRKLSTEPLETPGYYTTRVSVWSEEPDDNPEARRLADAEEISAFRVSSTGKISTPRRWIPTGGRRRPGISGEAGTRRRT